MSITGSPGLFGKQEKKASLVGKDIQAYCGRCKMNLMHTVISASEGKPERVVCKTCKTERAYRPPKAEGKADSKSKSKGGIGMSDRDEDLDLDQIDVSKVFLGEEGTKKKVKARAKAKKTKSVSESKTTSKPSAVPLSMQAAAPEDLLEYENKLSAMKNNLSNAKPYKATERFNAGDMIDHKVFGIGFVVAEVGLNKVEVLFREGRKLLVTASK